MNYDQSCLDSRVICGLLDHDTSLTALTSRLDCNYSGVSSGGPLVFLDDCRSLCDVATIFLAQYFQCSANDEEYDLHAKEHNGAFKSALRRRALRKDKTPPEGKQSATEKKKDGEESPKDRHKRPIQMIGEGRPRKCGPQSWGHTVAAASLISRTPKTSISGGACARVSYKALFHALDADIH